MKKAKTLRDYDQFIDPHARPAVQRWQRTYAINKNALPKLRNPQSQKILIGIYFTALALCLITAIITLFKLEAVLAWLPCTLAIVVAWTCLRITIDAKDSAPAEVLDEYELSIVEQWRERSHKGLSWSLFSVSMALILMGVTMGTNNATTLWNIAANDWMYALGQFGVVLYLAFAALPAVGYALNFPADGSPVVAEHSPAADEGARND